MFPNFFFYSFVSAREWVFKKGFQAHRNYVATKKQWKCIKERKKIVQKLKGISFCMPKIVHCLILIFSFLPCSYISEVKFNHFSIRISWKMLLKESQLSLIHFLINFHIIHVTIFTYFVFQKHVVYVPFCWNVCLFFATQVDFHTNDVNLRCK